MKSKFRFTITIVLAFILCFTLSGCGNTHWQFEQDVTEIESIEIIFIGNDTEIICQIDKNYFENVVNDIECLNAEYYGWNLGTGLGNAFKISFKNGDYDLITLEEPKHRYKLPDGTMNAINSWIIFDEKEFNELINKWIEISISN